MKIGIVTITEGENYGNRLQNFAVQHVIEKTGNQVETLHNYKDRNILTYRVKSRIKKILKTMLRKNDTNKMKRVKTFQDFNKEHINFSKYYISNINIKNKINEEYDYFICGSDQVWNSYFKENGYVNFLQFADEKKRIAFAPSFANEKVSEFYEEKYKLWLEGIPNLSVREDRGKEIIKELTGREDVEVLVDPTMLLTAEEWNKISKKPKQLKTNKYILNYFLGELSESRKNEIDRIAKENNCEVINILDKNSPFYATGPSEFLYLEKNAFLICTDSFHSSIFAILYNRPFIVFNREDKEVSMNSRLETLLSKFKLENRVFDGKITNELLNCDYTDVYEVLEKERKKSEKFLRKALNINNI